MVIQVRNTKINLKTQIHFIEHQVIFCCSWLLIPNNFMPGVNITELIIINEKLLFFTKEWKNSSNLFAQEKEKCFICSWSLWSPYLIIRYLLFFSRNSMIQLELEASGASKNSFEINDYEIVLKRLHSSINDLWSVGCQLAIGVFRGGEGHSFCCFCWRVFVPNLCLPRHKYFLFYITCWY